MKRNEFGKYFSTAGIVRRSKSPSYDNQRKLNFEHVKTVKTVKTVHSFNY